MERVRFQEIVLLRGEAGKIARLDDGVHESLELLKANDAANFTRCVEAVKQAEASLSELSADAIDRANKLTLRVAKLESNAEGLKEDLGRARSRAKVRL
jgi:hypothetical protein